MYLTNRFIYFIKHNCGVDAITPGGKSHTLNIPAELLRQKCEVVQDGYYIPRVSRLTPIAVFENQVTFLRIPRVIFHLDKQSLARLVYE